MIHFGDITKIDGKKVPFVDVITGGSPCQDLSIAGKRAGLAGARSGLFMEQIRVIKEMREASGTAYPRYMVWENVPGAFSSNKGKDFAAVLEETIRIVEPEAPGIEVPAKGWPTWGCYRDVDGRWSVAWRTLDAQYWGVPQRRRRIALVADFGGGSAPEILFERKSVYWDSETRGEAREGTSEGTERGAFTTSYALRMRGGCEGGGKGPLVQTEKSGTLGTGNDQTIFAFSECKKDDNCAFVNGKNGNVKSIDCRNNRISDISGTLQSKPNGGYRLNYINPVYVPPERENCLTPWDVQSRRIFDKDGVWPALYGGEGGGHGYVAGFLAGQGKGGIGYQEQVAPTMKAGSGLNDVPTICIQGNCVDRSDTAGCNGKGWKEDVSYTLNTVDRHCVAILPEQKENNPMLFENHSQDCRYKGPLDVCPMLPAQLGTGGNNTPFVVQAYSFDSLASNSMKSSNPHSGCRPVDIAKTLDTSYPDPSKNQGGIAIVQTYQDTTGTLSPGAHAGSYNGQDAYNDMLIAHPIRANPNCAFREDMETYPVSAGFVRRLTPLECERLQGFPDGWTNIGEWYDEKGKKHKPADSPRYKALGNSIALPPWRFVLGRIYANLTQGASLGSLFDGIGGFPLIWRELGGVPVWASEIEPFCIAVTERRFRE